MLRFKVRSGSALLIPSALPKAARSRPSSCPDGAGRWRRLAIVLFCGLVLLCEGWETLAKDAGPLNGRLDAIIRREASDNIVVSAQVADLETGRILMEVNPDTPLVPASAMKVITSAAALRVLGPDFTFLTEVLAEGVRGGSVGKLYLKGYGDPYLVSEELLALTRTVRERGLEEVRGDIVVDDGYLSPGKPLDEQEQLGHRAYHAPYSALSLNFNAIKLVIVPGEKPGTRARVMIEPLSEYASVAGQVKTVKGNSVPEWNISKKTTGDEREIITVEGTVGLNTQSRARHVNVSSPSLYTGEVFKEFLLREGIRVVGKVVRGQTPPSAKMYAEFRSRPLGSIVYWLNKFSNNFMAEQIGLVLGAKVQGVPGTREKGLAVLRKHLLDCGVEETGFSLSEASGLSRNNRVSASALVRVLTAAAKDFAYGAEFAASLSVAGVDGTLKEKFTEPGVRRRIRGKTGTLRGVNALAGYGVSPEGRRFAFAVIANHNDKGAGFIQTADNVVRQILDIPLGPR